MLQQVNLVLESPLPFIVTRLSDNDRKLSFENLEADAFQTRDGPPWPVSSFHLNPALQGSRSSLATRLVDRFPATAGSGNSSVRRFKRAASALAMGDATDSE